MVREGRLRDIKALGDVLLEVLPLIREREKLHVSAPECCKVLEPLQHRRQEVLVCSFMLRCSVCTGLSSCSEESRASCAHL